MHCHLPDLDVPDGLYDILGVGSLIHMQHLMNRQYYTGELYDGDLREDAVARVAYLILLRCLEKRCIFMLRGKRIPLIALADRCFIFFAAGLVKMKQKLHEHCPEVSGCDYRRFRKEVGAHVQANFSWLYARYCSLLHLDEFPFMWRDDDVSIHSAALYNGSEKTDFEFLDHLMFDPYGYELADDVEETEEDENHDDHESEDDDDHEDRDDEEDAEGEDMDASRSKHPRSGM
jgi:hypothetical protein